MKRRTLIPVLAIVLALGVASLAVTAASAKLRKKGASAPTAAVGIMAADLKWEPMPGIEGVQVAKLWGDMSKGAYGAFVKLSANQNHPLHTHTSTVKLVILSGEFTYTPEGGAEQRYGPGSYLMVPGGLKHSSGTGAEEVTMFQEQSGAWDMKPVGEGGAK